MKKLFTKLSKLVKKYLSVLVLLPLLLATFGSAFVGPVKADVSAYTASAFSQFCSNNPTICNKVDFTGTSGTVYCPLDNQEVQTVYVHAGDGQTVYELPNDGFSYNFVNNNNGVTVNVTSHPHNLSWIGVVCGDPGTPAPTATPTDTPTSSPTATPTATPGGNSTPTATPTGTPCTGNFCVIIDCPGQGTCEFGTGTPTPTATPSATPTATPSATPTSTPSDNGGGDNGGGSSDSGTGGGEVLGASTLAATGTSLYALATVAGMILTSKAAFNLAHEDRKN